jgi:hypothetical protein
LGRPGQQIRPGQEISAMKSTFHVIICAVVLSGVGPFANGFVVQPFGHFKTLGLRAGSRNSVSSYIRQPQSSLPISMCDVDSSKSSKEETTKDSSKLNSESERLSKWSKDFQYLPDVVTWNRGCAALQVSRPETFSLIFHLNLDCKSTKNKNPDFAVTSF